MPRKQQSFGGNMSFAFKHKTSKSIGKIKNKSGDYPRDRSFGSVVTRTPVDKFNLDATWSKWRKGYEYFTKQRWVPFDLEGLRAEIFPNFGSPLEVSFRATRFPTSSSDDSTHYTIERRVSPHDPFAQCQGRLTQIDGQSLIEVQDYYDERWELITYEGVPDILKLQVETLTTKDNYLEGSGVNTNKTKTTDAIVKNFLTVDTSFPEQLTKNKVVPAVYTGSTLSGGTKLTIKAAQIFGYDGTAGAVYPLKDTNLQDLVGNQISIFRANAFYDINSNDYSFDELNNKKIKSKVDIEGNFIDTPCRFFIYDAKPLSDDNGVIYERDFKALGLEANFSIEGEYIFDKDTYQRWFVSEFNSTVLRDLAEIYAPLIPTAMTIQSIARVGGSDTDAFPENEDNIIIELVPFTSQVLYCKRPFGVEGIEQASYIMSNPKKSFTQMYNTLEEGSNDILKTRMNINVNCDIDETFVAGDYLFLADRFSCDCPSYSKAVLRAPEQRYEDGLKKANRQRKYPLPSAGANRSNATIDNANDNAGIFNTWISDKDRQVFQCCKHTVSAYFEKGISIIEPNQVPIYQDLEQIENKISNEVDGVISGDSIKRAEISSIGFVWAIVQLLVQSNSAVIATSQVQEDFMLRPLEYYYSFKKVRDLIPETSTMNNQSALFEPRAGNKINL